MVFLQNLTPVELEIGEHFMAAQLTIKHLIVVLMEAEMYI